MVYSNAYPKPWWTVHSTGGIYVRNGCMPFYSSTSVCFAFVYDAHNVYASYYSVYALFLCEAYYTPYMYM